jgi:hypothetical protein
LDGEPLVGEPVGNLLAVEPLAGDLLDGEPLVGGPPGDLLAGEPLAGEPISKLKVLDFVWPAVSVSSLTVLIFLS